ncbi:MAG: hypothetical protein IJU27_05780 [Bacteroidales bacterium]|nr:hypothetical protein [Bacteroidales bacterium]
MKKTFISLALVACTIMLISCGNSGDKKSEAKQSEPAATSAAAQKALTLGDVNNENYAELIKARCGVDPNPGGDLVFYSASASPGNANLTFKGAKGIEERDLQKIIFERCQVVADGGAIYKLESNAGQGIHKGDPIKSFDQLNGFQWVYEYKGALVNCSASKYGGSKSADRFELRFGR